MECNGSANSSCEPSDHTTDDPEVPHFYDRHPWKIGETYRIRVSHIYDLSKFWIVLLEQELTLFQKVLHNWYSENGKQYKISPENVKKKLYCVAFTEGNFCRGIIVDIPQFTNSTQKAMVYLIDYGRPVPVKLEHLYYFHTKLYQVPRFAVRACLSQIQPSDGYVWKQSTIQRFNELVCKKVLLCLLEGTDPLNKIVYIALGDIDQHSQVHNVSDTLLNEKLAMPITARTEIWKNNKSMFYVKTYPFLYPTFEAIERCEMPSTAKVFDTLKQSKSSFKQIQPYYYQIDSKNGSSTR